MTLFGNACHEAAARVWCADSATICAYSRASNYLNLSSLRSGLFDERNRKNTFSQKKYFWQENEDVILDDGNLDGTKTTLHPCRTV